MALDSEICDFCQPTYDHFEGKNTLIVGSSRTSPFHSGEHCSGTGTSSCTGLSSSSSRTMYLKAAETKTTDKRNIEICTTGSWTGESLRVSIAGIGDDCDFNITDLRHATAAQSIVHKDFLKY